MGLPSRFKIRSEFETKRVLSLLILSTTNWKHSISLSARPRKDTFGNLGNISTQRVSIRWSVVNVASWHCQDFQIVLKIQAIASVKGIKIFDCLILFHAIKLKDFSILVVALSMRERRIRAKITTIHFKFLQVPSNAWAVVVPKITFSNDTVRIHEGLSYD